MQPFGLGGFGLSQRSLAVAAPTPAEEIVAEMVYAHPTSFDGVFGGFELENVTIAEGDNFIWFTIGVGTRRTEITLSVDGNPATLVVESASSNNAVLFRYDAEAASSTATVVVTHVVSGAVTVIDFFIFQVSGAVIPQVDESVANWVSGASSPYVSPSLTCPAGGKIVAFGTFRGGISAVSSPGVLIDADGRNGNTVALGTRDSTGAVTFTGGNGSYSVGAMAFEPLPIEADELTLAFADDHESGDQPNILFAFPENVIGAYLQVQVAADSGFTTALTGEDAIRDNEGLRQLTFADFTDGDGDTIIEFNPAIEELFNVPGGTIHVRSRYGWDDGEGGTNWEEWSNTLTDTVTAVSSGKLSDIYKHLNVLTDDEGGYTDTRARSEIATVNAYGTCRVDAGRSDRRYWEVQYIQGASQVLAGFTGDGRDWDGSGPNIVLAGDTSSCRYGSNGGFARNGVTSPAISFPSTTNTWSALEIIGFEPAPALGKFWISKNGVYPSGHDPETNTGGYSLSAFPALYFPAVAVYVTNTGNPTNDTSIIEIRLNAAQFTYSGSSHAQAYNS